MQEQEATIAQLKQEFNDGPRSDGNEGYRGLPEGERTARRQQIRPVTNCAANLRRKWSTITISSKQESNKQQ